MSTDQQAPASWGTHPGQLDWLAIWRAMYDAERAQGEAAAPAGHDCWAGRAPRYAAAMRRAPQPDALMQAVLPQLRPTDTVLDIGAGTGRYTTVLAQHVAHVVALEPSAAMREQLVQAVAESGLTNITIVAEGFPPATPVRGDVAFSAHVLYGVREFAPFVQAMHASATRTCMLALMIRHLSGLVSPFWELFYGEPRAPLPAALEAFNALYQLGYLATWQLLPSTTMRYATLDEAVEDMRVRLRFLPDPERDARLREALRERLVVGDDALLAFPDQLAANALIQWDVT